MIYYFKKQRQRTKNITAVEIHTGCSEVIMFNINRSIIVLPKVICVTKKQTTYQNAVENCQLLGGNLLNIDHVDLQTNIFTKYEINHTTNANASFWVANWKDGDDALQWTTKGQPNKTQCTIFENTDSMGFSAESCDTKHRSLCDFSTPIPRINLTLPSLNIPTSIDFFTTLSTLTSNDNTTITESSVSLWCKLLFRLFC